jgi:beta-glucosidase
MIFVCCVLLCQTSSEVLAQLPVAKAVFIERLLGQMTTAEKVGQLNLVYLNPQAPSPELLSNIAQGLVGGAFVVVPPTQGGVLQRVAVQESRLGIPVFFSSDVIHGYHTVFPISLGLAASWDLSAVALVARTGGEEASAEGLHLTYGPMLDITRDPRWGRVSEGYGEDPYLVSQIARVMVRAYQGESLRTPGSIMAGVKHVALYGAVEGGRDYNSVDMSVAQMNQYYFPPYRAAVEAGAGVAMLAFNTINGVPGVANPWLIKEVLRGEWGFEGVTLSDYGAIGQLIDHGVARNARQAAALALESGVEMALEERNYVKELVGLIESNEVEGAHLDAAVRHVLGMKYDMGLFDDPYRNLNTLSNAPVEQQTQRDAARSVAQKTFVLLKNASQVLPLSKKGRIALIGPLAKSRRDLLGSYCGICSETNVISIYDGMANALEGKATLSYARGANVTVDGAMLARFVQYQSPLEHDLRSPDELLREALEVARAADVIVVTVGEAWNMNDEGVSRAHIDLPSSQKVLLRRLKALGKPLIVVLVNGRPLDLTQEHELADALLETWFSGAQGGNAVADVLFGDVNPSGKLPMTFPRSVGQIPIYYNHLNTGRAFTPDSPHKYMSQYIDEQDGPLYPFGYGLSYTRFELSDLQLSAPTLLRSETLKASVELANTGKRDGETVVQLYIRDPVASISRPVKELKGFQKIMLKAGERRRIEFIVGEEDLKFYDAQLRHVAEPGEFRVQVGLDSRDVIEQRFELR